MEGTGNITDNSIWISGYEKDGWLIFRIDIKKIETRKINQKIRNFYAGIPDYHPNTSNMST